MLISIACFGAFFNRFRGGGGTDLLNYFGIDKSFPAQKTIYAILSAFVLVGLDWYRLGFATVGVRAAVAFGWGSYIKGLTENKIIVRGDLEFVDKIIVKFKFAILANLFALSVRGAIWGACVVFGVIQVQDSLIVLQIKYLLLIPMFAFFFPLSYFMVRNCKDNWGLGEMIFGAICWVCYYLISVL